MSRILNGIFIALGVAVVLAGVILDELISTGIRLAIFSWLLG